MNTPEYLLVIANSGRMLTEAAARAGLKALSIDLHADVDTRCLAADWAKIPELAPEHIAPVLDEFIQRYSVQHAVYGSGFESHGESLVYLSERLTILGNSPDAFLRTQNKYIFFSALTQLNIAYPEVAFAAPFDGGGWLAKPMQGYGGLGIHRYEPGRCLQSSVYWQRFEEGTAHSALFLADGIHAQLIGFNTQWPVSLSERGEFIFSGIMNHCELSSAEQALVTKWVERCAREFGLKGLNSLDFIRTDKQCLALEINARPPISMQLHDDLLGRHIQAVHGVLTGTRAEPIGCTGLQIVYAEQDWLIPAKIQWPKECADRPEIGTRCRKGQPVCSIIARRNNSQQVWDQLIQLQKQIVNQMIKV